MDAEAAPACTGDCLVTKGSGNPLRTKYSMFATTQVMVQKIYSSMMRKFSTRYMQLCLVALDHQNCIYVATMRYKYGRGAIFQVILHCTAL